LRTRPGHPSEEYRFYYCAPRVPGERGAFKAVEFPEPMFAGQKNVYPMGIRAKDAAPDPGLPAGRTATVEETE
jgi:hypothetical protein